MRTSASLATRAFTLVEILMAMAIFAMVLTAIYATWTAILRGTAVGTTAAAQVQRERVAIQTIEQALTSARSFTLDMQHYGFMAENGSEALLSFVARLPKSFPRGGRFEHPDGREFPVRRVAFSLEDGPDSQPQLVLRQCPLLMEFDQDEKEHPLVLAKHVKELKFDCWDPRLNDWTDTWENTNQLPKLIRVTLQMSPPGRRAGTSLPEEEVSRVIALPSVAVPANWQRPNPQRPPGAP